MARRRWISFALLGSAGLAGGVVALLTGGWIWLRSESGQAWLERSVLDALNTGPSQATIGDLRTDLWSRVVIEDLALQTPEGTVVRVGRLVAEIDRTALAGLELRFRSARAESVYLELRAAETASEAPFTGLPIDLDIDRLDLEAVNLVYRTTTGAEALRVVGLSGSAAIQARGETIRVDDVAVAGLLGLQGALPAQIDGSLHVDGDGAHLEAVSVRLPNSQLEVTGLAGPPLDLAIDLQTLHGPDIDTLLGGVGLGGDLAGEATLTGPTQAIAFTVDLTGIADTRGQIRGGGVIDPTADEVEWTAALSLDGLHVEDVYPQLGDAVAVTGDLSLEGVGTQWPTQMRIRVGWNGTEHDVFGQQIDAFQGQFFLDRGTVTLEQTQLDGILGELEVTGDLDAVVGLTDLTVRGWVRPSRLRELGIERVDRSGYLVARLSGNLRDLDAPVRVSGQVRFAPFVSGTDARFEEMVVDFRATRRGERVDGTASVLATEGTSYGATLATTRSPSVQFSIDDAGLRASGDLEVSGLEMPDRFEAASARGTWQFDSAPALSAQLTLGAYTLLSFPGTDADIRVGTTDREADVELALRDGTRELLSTRGQYDLVQREVHLDHLLLAPTPRAQWTAPDGVRFTLTDAGVTDAQIGLVGGLGNLTVEGTLGTSGPVDGHVVISALQLDTLAEMAPDRFDGLAGELDVDLSVKGTAAAAQLDGDAAVRRLWVDGLTRWLDLTATFTAADDNLGVAVDVGVAGEPLASAWGDLPVQLDLADPGLDPDGEIALSLAILPGDLERLARAAPRLKGIPKGRVGGVVELSGAVVDPDFRLAGVTEVDIPGWDDPGRAELEWKRSGGAFSGWIEIRDGYEARARVGGFGQTHLSQLARQAMEEGALPEDFDWTTLADSIVMQGAFLGFPVQSLAAAAGIDVPLEGDVVGGFGLTGDAATPVLDASLTWVGGTVGSLGIDNSLVSLSPSETGYALDANLDFEGGGDLRVQGNIPLAVDLRTDRDAWSTTEMNLRVSGSGVPLGILSAYDPSLTNASGLIALTGGIRGTVSEPLPALTARMEDGSVVIPDLGLRFSEIHFDAMANHRALTLSSFNAVTSPSRRRRVSLDLQDLAETRLSEINATAEATLVDGGLGDVQAQIGLSGGTWVANTPRMVLRMDGDLSVSGPWPAVQVQGELDLRSSQVIVDAAAFLEQAPLEPDPRIRITRPTGSAEQIQTEPPWYADATATIDVNLNRTLELAVTLPFLDDFGSLGAAVTAADLTTRLGGSTTLGLANGQPTLNGKVDVLDGRLKLFQARFDLTQGEVTFTGAQVYDPTLNLNGEMKIPGATVTARITGTAERPDITTDSEEYKDESQRLLILLTGRTPDDLTSQGGEGAAMALARMAASSFILGQEVGNLSLETDGSVRFGAPVSSSIYLTSVAWPQAPLGDNHASLEAEAGITRQLVLDGGVGDVYSWMDLFWEIRF